MINPQSIWVNFKTAFCEALDETDKTKFLEAWQSLPTKTVYYEWTLMPAVAAKLGFRMQTERHRSDYTFLNSDAVPIIFGESENNHTTAGQEMECLCSLASPLKFLLICCTWQATEERKFLPWWAEIIRNRHAVVSMDCLYAIVVLEWDTSMKCSFTLLDTTGNVIEKSLYPAKT